MGRRSFSREFKVEAVRLIKDRGVSVAQASTARTALAYPSCRDWRPLRG